MGPRGPFQFLGVLVVSLGFLGIAAGLGLLRLYGWARLVAGALAVVLLVINVPLLMVEVAHGGWLGIAWLFIVADLAVLFAVVRRWPAELKR